MSIQEERTPSDKDMSDAWRSFIGATRRLRTRQAAEGLSVSQLHLLTPLIGSPDGQSVGSLAEDAEIASPTATRMLDGLERDGLVQRQTSVDDRRRVVIRLTDAGRNTVERELERLDAGNRQLFGSLSDDERRKTYSVLTKMSERMNDFTSSPMAAALLIFSSHGV
jgi:DNA-binding MarR family transcriptional regulator